MWPIRSGPMSGPSTTHEPAGEQRAHDLVVVILVRARPGGRRERRLLPQDRRVERLERGARLDPELVDERRRASW